MSTYLIRQSCRAVFYGVLAMLATHAAAAEVNTAAYGEGRLSVGPVYDPVYNFDFNATSSQSSLTVFSAAGGDVISAYAAATAGLQFVKVQTDTRAYGPMHTVYYTQIGAGASGGYTDSITLSSPGQEGKSGRITAAFYVNYGLYNSASIDGIGSLSNSIRVNAAFGDAQVALREATEPYYNEDRIGRLRLTASTTYTTPAGSVTVDRADHWLYLTTDYVWGQSIDLAFTMTVGASVASNGRELFSGVNASHSGYWAGIVAAEADGIAVTQFTALSSDGLDYAASAVPVPEPSEWAMLLTGFVLMAGMALRGHVSTARRAVADV